MNIMLQQEKKLKGVNYMNYKSVSYKKSANTLMLIG